MARSWIDIETSWPTDRTTPDDQIRDDLDTIAAFVISLTEDPAKLPHVGDARSPADPSGFAWGRAADRTRSWI